MIKRHAPHLRVLVSGEQIFRMLRDASRVNQMSTTPCARSVFVST